MARFPKLKPPLPRQIHLDREYTLTEIARVVGFPFEVRDVVSGTASMVIGHAPAERNWYEEKTHPQFWTLTSRRAGDRKYYRLLKAWREGQDASSAGVG